VDYGQRWLQLAVDALTEIWSADKRPEARRFLIGCGMILIGAVVLFAIVLRLIYPGIGR
jgi:hypothetical protein